MTQLRVETTRLTRRQTQARKWSIYFAVVSVENHDIPGCLQSSRRLDVRNVHPGNDRVQ